MGAKPIVHILMFTEIRSSWKIRGLNPVFVRWQDDAGKRGTWAFLPKDAQLSPAPNSAGFSPKLLLALLPSSVSYWDALWGRHSSFLLVSLCRWDAEGADMVRADSLPKSVWLHCLLPIQHFFGGCQGFEGSHGLKVVTLLLDDLLGSLFLMWQNQAERLFASACWNLCWILVDGKSLKGWCGASDAQCKKKVINGEFWAGRISSVWGHLHPCFLVVTFCRVLVFSVFLMCLFTILTILGSK